MKTRKELKCIAKQNMKKHYWLFVIVCLIAAILGTEFSDSLAVTKMRSSSTEENSVTSESTVLDEINFGDVVYAVLTNNIEEASEMADELITGFTSDSPDKSSVFGRSRGVFAELINGLASGGILVRFATTLDSLFNSAYVTTGILVVLGFSIIFLIWMCVKNIYGVVARRIFLEGRTYEKVPTQRFLFLISIGKWWKVSVSMLVLSIYQFLWTLTIIGGIIKHYSYFLVPYIIAENPDVAPNKAITLSRNMMKGHKWECFVYELSFIGWRLLSLLTFGITDVFFTNPYRLATFSEYYSQLREAAKENKTPDFEIMNDYYLFSQAEQEKLTLAYNHEIGACESGCKGSHEPQGFLRKFADFTGIALSKNEEDILYREEQECKCRDERFLSEISGLTYPTRLSPLSHEEKQVVHENIHYDRRYTIWSIVLLFFTFSMIGWIWEVSLHLVGDGVFINRGTLHGPWLPIYGSGGILILLFLNKLRKKPIAEFFGIIALCGVLEYFTSLVLEIMHDGTRWWDYTGYFLNLHGRICAEGLLVFAIGGMAVVYLIAPHLDTQFRRIKKNVLIPICVTLLILFGTDVVCSFFNPNTGKGITNDTSSKELIYITNQFDVSQIVQMKGYNINFN